MAKYYLIPRKSVIVIAGKSYTNDTFSDAPEKHIDAYIARNPSALGRVIGIIAQEANPTTEVQPTIEEIREQNGEQHKDKRGKSKHAQIKQSDTIECPEGNSEC